MLRRLTLFSVCVLIHSLCLAAPVIVQQPKNLTVQSGASASFSVQATAEAPMNYAWFFNGEQLSDGGGVSGSSTAILTIADVTESRVGAYFVVVGDGVEEVESSAAELALAAPVVAPAIVTQPVKSTVNVGETASFKVVGSGDAPLKYEWSFKGTKLSDSTRITGSSTSTLTIAQAVEADSGDYRVTISNAGGTVQSQAASLTVTPPTTGPSDSWTIIVYGHADHNLSQSLVADMLEMEKVGSGSGLNIVVQADFDASAANNGLPAELKTGVTRFLVTKGTDPSAIGSRVIERLPESNNMDDPKVLEDFMTWAIQKYPAKKYGLVFWNHGGQYVGYGGDSQDGTLKEKGILSTLQIRTVMNKVRPAGTTPSWDFVGFDTCLMGGAEVLYDFAPLTDVFIACPEIDMGDGWNYEVLNLLKERPTMTGLEFALEESASWKEHHMKEGKDADLELAAHSIYDLRKFTAFETEFRAFATALLGVTDAAAAEIPKHRVDTTQYSVPEVKDLGKPTDFVDLGEYADRLISSTTIPAAVKASAQRLVAAIDAMVVSKVMGKAKLKAHGLSVYYPVRGAGSEGSYTKLTPSIAASAPWLNFLAAVSAKSGGDSSAPGVTEETSGEGALLAQRGASRLESAAVSASSTTVSFRVAAGDDLFSYTVSLVSTNYTGKANEYTYLGDIARGRINGPGAYKVQWDGKVAALSDGKGAPVILGGTFESPGSDLFVSYAEATYPGEQDQELVILLSRIGPNGGVVISALDGEADEMAPRGIELEPGTILTPLYYVEQRVGEDPAKWTSDVATSPRGIVVPANGLDGLKVVDVDLPASGYELEVLANDMFLNPSSIISYPVRLAAPVSAPKLGLKFLATGSLEVRWQASATGFVLEQTSDVSKGWTPVAAGQVRSEGSDSVYSVPATGSAAFFRLKRN